MSITRNVGGVAEYLARQRLKPQYLSFKKYYRAVTARTRPGRRLYRLTHGIKKAVKESLLPCSMFEDMGFTYLGPVDGHDVKGLTQLLTYARDLEGPVLLHVRTVKGKGYPPAEANPDAFHGVAPFDVQTGEPRKAAGENFSAVFGRTLCRLAREDGRVCAVTAAMQTGTGLEPFAQAYPRRFFDVGIAEGHAVAMAAGMAKQGAVPVFAVYSTFLQRGYDMLIHDVAIQHLHVVLAVDRAGLVGEDGETHHGVFDVAFLSSVPGMTVFAPANFSELDRMLERAVKEMEGPVAVRFPRGGQGEFREDAGDAPAAVLRRGEDITLVSYGTMINNVLAAARLLEERGIRAEVVKLNVIAPLQAETAARSVEKTGALLVAEECVERGGVGERLAAALELAGLPARVALCSCGERFVPHGSAGELQRQLGLDPEGLARRAEEVLRG